MSQDLIRLVEARAKKENVSHFEIGDVVNVHCKILEGDKERVQIFNGVVIARSGSGVREMFTVRRIVAGQGVERKFPVHSPRIAKVEVLRSSIVRRAKLYYLRDRVGKATRLAQRRVERTDAQQTVAKTMKRGKKAAQARRAAAAAKQAEAQKSAE
ncbi:MAG: 50S ribosomal protein L19 [Thermoguttaceae bacterium]|nr:50S ribosomal protein L19 [Thermoguttaceae bacterium]